MIATQTLASGPPSAQGLPVYGRDGLKIWPAWPGPPDGWNLPDRSTTPRGVDLPTVFDNPPRTTIRPGPGAGRDGPKFYAPAAMLAVSTLTPTPIVEETATLRR